MCVSIASIFSIVAQELGDSLDSVLKANKRKYFSHILHNLFA